MLENPAVVDAFKRFLKTEYTGGTVFVARSLRLMLHCGTEDNLRFWEEVNEYWQLTDSNQKRKKAKRIADTYTASVGTRQSILLVLEYSLTSCVVIVCSQSNARMDPVSLLQNNILRTLKEGPRVACVLCFVAHLALPLCACTERLHSCADALLTAQSALIKWMEHESFLRFQKSDLWRQLIDKMGGSAAELSAEDGARSAGSLSGSLSLSGSRELKRQPTVRA